MLKAYEYRVYPNKEQEERIKQHFGCSRWVYNYALEKKIKAWTTEKKNLGHGELTLGESSRSKDARLNQEVLAFRQG